jgi:hypothetical protein
MFVDAATLRIAYRERHGGGSRSHPLYDDGTLYVEGDVPDGRFGLRISWNGEPPDVDEIREWVAVQFEVAYLERRFGASAGSRASGF